MEKIRAVIIDDEQSACNILSQLLDRFCTQIEVVAMESDLPSGVASITEHKPDVVFLDIQMPKYSGFEIVNFFPTIDFEIIFVTAYDHYAVKAFDISAVDYLLKPIEIDKLKLAVAKLEKKMEGIALRNNYNLLLENLKEKKFKQLVIPHEGDYKALDLDEVIAIEAQESYSRIYTETKRYLISRNLKHFENTLSTTPSFFRTHKSWLINLKHINTYSKSKQEITLTNEIIAKLSKLKKASFEKVLKAE